MKIVLLCGMSGTGKTAIAKNLCDRYDKYHFVDSYTDRDKREKNEWGHKFVDKQFMDLLLERANIVAQSKIENNRYCSIDSQFDKDKINLYIADVNGVNDTIKHFPFAEIMTILIRRNDIEADCVRVNRNVLVPSREDVDFLVDNDGTIESAANLINTLVNIDCFKKPSHLVQTLGEKIDYIDEQYRFLDNIKESLYEQIWYKERNNYIQLCKYVEREINDDFDFTIDIVPDTAPEIYDGELTFNVQGIHDYEDITWEEVNRMVEQLSSYAYSYCNDHNLDLIKYHLAVSEHWLGVDKYE